MEKVNKKRLHLGCGPVYLEGYINIDAKGELASKNLELVEENKTILDKYYKNPYVKRILGHNKRGRIVVDIKADILKLPFKENSIDEILTVNVIDHLRLQDFPIAIKEWHRVLKPGGSLIIDVGDCVANAEMMVEASKAHDENESLEWALRLMYCHGRDKYDCHHWGYTPSYLGDLLAPYGFRSKWVRRNYIKHVYPAFQLCVDKR